MTYHQRSGQAFIGVDFLGQGWSGQLQGQNNPDMQNVPNVGPIPRGLYAIGDPYHHPHLGPVVFDLTPDPSNEMFGRSLFRIHGASYQHPELSSEGCIILSLNIREQIAFDSETHLEVKE